jgi:hypothetical protein
VKLNEERIGFCALRVIILGQIIGDWYWAWDVGAWHGGLDERSVYGKRLGCNLLRRLRNSLTADEVRCPPPENGYAV